MVLCGSLGFCVVLCGSGSLGLCRVLGDSVWFSVGAVGFCVLFVVLCGFVGFSVVLWVCL